MRLLILKKAVESTASGYYSNYSRDVDDFLDHRMGDTPSAKNRQHLLSYQHINHSRYVSSAFFRIIRFSTLATSLLLSGCIHKGTNPIDPYEPINRKIHKFNMAIDTIALKPTAKLYKAVFASPIRAGINNAYNNLFMLPSAASDLLQGDWRNAIKDSWRFLINSTFGVAGIFDLADKSFGLPPHYNDLGLTFAKWGDKKSPYIVLPLLGPSTIRDAMSLPFDYLLTPYPYLPGTATIYALGALRYVDLRSQLLETDRLLDEALDKYSFIRDAYLQHRNYLISGEKSNENDSLYIDEGDVSGYVDKQSPPAKQ